MSLRRIVPAAETRVEMRAGNSRFIATAAPAAGVEEARAIIDRMRQEFADASHNVPAFVIGHGSTTVAHCHDDGEPSGTAGRPMLAVLQGSGIGDIVVVVTRYFGGTKLGTGGLVRAYSDAVRLVLDQLPLAEKVPTVTLTFSLPYALLERARQIVEAHHGQLLEEDFAADVTLLARFRQAVEADFCAALISLAHGQVEIQEVDRDNATLMPLSAPDENSQ